MTYGDTTLGWRRCFILPSFETPPDDLLAPFRSHQTPCAIGENGFGPSLSLSTSARGGALLVPSTAGTGVRWAAAMGLVIGVMASGVPVLYRHAPSFWVVRRPKAC
jgi:hypothetical protein